MDFLREARDAVGGALQSSQDVLGDALQTSQLALTGTLSGDVLATTVRDAVEAVQVIDLHTHLLPPDHGDFMLFGIDELLTYHYLVSEYFMVADGITHEEFFALPKAGQADLVWKALFVDRSPLSEASIGVLTVLQRLGLGDLAASKDLAAVREWFAQQDPHKYAEHVFQLSGVRYNIMTNVVFNPAEAACWVSAEDSKIDYVSGEFAAKDILPQSYDKERFKTAVRIDPLLKGDWATICAALSIRGLPQTLEGARKFLGAWVAVLKPEYLIASTPEDFKYGDPSRDIPAQEGWPSVTQLVDEVMVPIATNSNLALVIKFGACRGMSPGLAPCGGGDGVCAVADTRPLKQMCLRHPKVKFMATFLSRVNQHEVCVLTQKFRNLHVYGCWWYCNNPSMIEEITRMRLEMLGTAFTCQHSDARVIDQLIYKWSHSRNVIANALIQQYEHLFFTGWHITPEAIKSDVHRLFGGAYEEFLRKTL